MKRIKETTVKQQISLASSRIGKQHLFRHFISVGMHITLNRTLFLRKINVYVHNVFFLINDLLLFCQ